MHQFQPDLSILPRPQLALWGLLRCIPKHFVLYGGTALALRLGHRTSVDYDFFSASSFEPLRLFRSLSSFENKQVMQTEEDVLANETLFLNQGMADFDWRRSGP